MSRQRQTDRKYSKMIFLTSLPMRSSLFSTIPQGAMPMATTLFLVLLVRSLMASPTCLVTPAHRKKDHSKKSFFISFFFFFSFLSFTKMFHVRHTGGHVLLVQTSTVYLLPRVSMKYWAPSGLLQPCTVLVSIIKKQSNITYHFKYFV